jgi:hypothetical protein
LLLDGEAQAREWHSYFITFKVLRGDILKVTIFDYNMTEVMKRCPQQDSSLAIIDE